ncbi:MAG: hypothetical protein F4222_07325 [Gammaproteobacteria bacterium]|nr:hypothetical protein [Gammaproteobacteria bacterium]MYF58861.1 hypothetical protein [Gammaproteobacteria bacterium]
MISGRRRLFLAPVAGIAALVALACPAAAQDSGRDGADAGWYIGVGLGANRGSTLDQEGWNRESFCYPDAACFDQDPVPLAPGYRWRYDVGLDGGGAFELSAGRFFGRTRLELALAQQRNDTNQMFRDITYYDGAAIRPRPGGTVEANGRATIDHLSVRSVTLDAYYDFTGAWGAITPYAGAGLGLASVEFANVFYASDYQDTSAGGETYDPPLSFYNSAQNNDLNDSVVVWRLHAGADYNPGGKVRVGLKLTWSATGDFEDMGDYEYHPMHQLDPDLTNTNTFSGTRSWTLMLTVKRLIGD